MTEFLTQPSSMLVILAIIVLLGIWYSRVWRLPIHPAEVSGVTRTTGYVYLAEQGDLLKIGMTGDIERRAKELADWHIIDVWNAGSREEAYRVETRFKQALSQFDTFGRVYSGKGWSEVWHKSDIDATSLHGLSYSLS